MSTQPPLTAAERAAARELSRIYNRRDDIPVELEPADFADEARAVVAAVRPILAAEALSQAAERVLDQADLIRKKFPTQPRGWNRSYGLSEAASMLRADAQSLSRPTSKETDQ